MKKILTNLSVIDPVICGYHSNIPFCCNLSFNSGFHGFYWKDIMDDERGTKGYFKAGYIPCHSCIVKFLVSKHIKWNKIKACACHWCYLVFDNLCIGYRMFIVKRIFDFQHVFEIITDRK